MTDQASSSDPIVIESSANPMPGPYDTASIATYQQATPPPADEGRSSWAVRAIEGKWTATITLIVFLVATAVSVVVWATSQHDGIKDWTVEKDFATKTEVMEIVEKHYVTSKDFQEVKTRQETIKEKIDDVSNKVDEMHELLMKGRIVGRSARHVVNVDN